MYFPNCSFEAKLVKKGLTHGKTYWQHAVLFRKAYGSE